MEEEERAIIEATHISPSPEDVIVKGPAALVSGSKIAVANSKASKASKGAKAKGSKAKGSKKRKKQ